MGAVRQNSVLARDALGRGPQRTRRFERGVAPAIHHVAFGIEFDHRGRSLRLERPSERARTGVSSPHVLWRNQTARLEAAGDDEEVILRVYARPANLARHPVIRQWLGPERIDLEDGRDEPLFRFRRAGDRLHADKADADGDAQANGSRKNIPFVCHDTPLMQWSGQYDRQCPSETLDSVINLLVL